ncbi:MAG TPA: nitroreductase/quinone reductase family protein [Chloroflexota bacterium]
MGLIDPGRTEQVIFDLTRGTYAMACFVAGPEGVPHMDKGMLTQVQVMPSSVPTPSASSGATARDTAGVHRDDDGRYVVVASNGGRPTHPAWLDNLRAHPDVTVEVDGERFQARATMADGAERDRLYARHARALDSPGAPRGLPSFSD